MDRFYTFKPNVMTPSLRYSENPSSLRVNETKATCDGSMAYIEIAVGPASMFTFWTRSLIDSIIFYSIILRLCGIIFDVILRPWGSLLELLGHFWITFGGLGGHFGGLEHPKGPLGLQMGPWGLQGAFGTQILRLLVPFWAHFGKAFWVNFEIIF